MTLAVEFSDQELREMTATAETLREEVERLALHS